MLSGEGKSVIELLRAILVSEMEMGEDRVMIYDEKWKIPTDKELFITLELKSVRTIANRKAYEDVDGTLQEVQMLNTQERYVIGIFSADFSAYQRKEEVAMAFNSDFAQSTMEANSFSMSRVLPAEDLSQLEASQMLRRFDIEVVVLAWYEKSKAVKYYDSYRVRVQTEDTTVNFDQPTEDPNA